MRRLWKASFICVVVFLVLLFGIDPNIIDISILKSFAEYLPLFLVLSLLFTALVAGVYVVKASYFKSSQKVLFVAALFIFGIFTSAFLYFYTRAKEQELS